LERLHQEYNGLAEETINCERPDVEHEQRKDPEERTKTSLQTQNHVASTESVQPRFHDDGCGDAEGQPQTTELPNAEHIMVQPLDSAGDDVADDKAGKLPTNVQYIMVQAREQNDSLSIPAPADELD